jgi:hypothetical protein
MTTSRSSSTVKPATSASTGTSDRTRPALPGIVVSYRSMNHRQIDSMAAAIASARMPIRLEAETLHHAFARLDPWDHDAARKRAATPILAASAPTKPP